MQKTLSLLIVCLLLFSNSKGQNAFYDAIKIDSLLKTNNKSDTSQAFLKMFPYFLADGQLDYARFFSLLNPQTKSAAVNYLYGSKDTIILLCGQLGTTLEETALSVTCRNFKAAIDSESLHRTQQSSLESEIDLKLKELNTKVKELAVLSQQIPIDTTDSVRIASINNLRIDTASLNQIINNKNIEKAMNATRLNSASSLVASLRIQFIDGFERLTNARRTHILNTVYHSSIANLASRIEKNDPIYYEVLKENQEKERLEAYVNAPTTSLTNFKMPTQSELIDALAIYIARRFKQEVAITLIAELRKLLNRQPLLTQLFPETIKLFNNGDDFELPKFGKMWNYAISEDFIKLPKNIVTSTYIESYAKKAKTLEVYNLFKDIVNVSTMVNEKNSLPEIVSLYKADTTLIKSDALQQCFEIFNMVNKELYFHDNTSTKSEQFWISWNSLENITSDQYNMFLILLEARYGSVFDAFKIKKPSQWMDASISRKAAFKKYLVKTLLVLNNLQRSQKQYLDRLEKDPNSIYTGVNFWDAQKNLFSTILNQDILNIPQKFETCLQMLDKGADIYKLMEQKNYPAMVHEAVSILEYVLPSSNNRINEMFVKSWKLNRKRFREISPAFLLAIDSLQSKVDTIVNLIEKRRGSLPNNVTKRVRDSTLMATYDSIRASVESYFNFAQEDASRYRKLMTIKTARHFDTLMHKLITNQTLNVAYIPENRKSRFVYITKSAEFFTDIMSAGDSKQLANVIEAYSMPPNSYKIKRGSRFSVDLNAYIGAYGGVEWIKKSDTVSHSVKQSGKAVYGFSVPVGITLSWGIRKNPTLASSTSFVTSSQKIKDITGNCFSVGITLIDIAAVVSYRLDKGENIALPKEVRWAQILSPGVHASMGIRNTPLNITTGFQYTPQLRNLNEASDMQQAYRIYAGLFFDLPLFNIYKR